MINTGAEREAVASTSPFTLPRPASADEIQPDLGLDGAGRSGEDLGMGFARRIPSSSQKDWGHITPSAHVAAGALGHRAHAGRAVLQT